MPASAQPIKVIPRASHMFAQRQAKPVPRTVRQPRAIEVRGSSPLSGFASAGGGALYGDFRGSWGMINSDLRFALPMMRARSRQQARDNEYAKAYLRALLNNVLGSEGVKFDSQVRNPVLVKTDSATGKTGKTGGDLDVFANKVIEDARRQFERRENYTVTRRTTRRDAQKLYLTCCAIDGELFIRKVRGYDNAFRFATQLIPPEAVDINYNADLPNGNKVIMGIEKDKWGARVAYHILTGVQNPPASAWTINATQASYGPREVVSASEIQHVFIEEFPGQERGIPFLQSAMQKLHQLGAYEEAAIINARVGATKMGFFKKTTPDGFMDAVAGKDQEEVEELYPGNNFYGGTIVDAPEPGQWVELPPNVEPVNWTPNYPDAQFDPFVKAALRGVAAAIGTSYMTLSNDLSEANFSSLRAGLTEEREQWKMLQRWWIEGFCEPEFADWLYMALGNGNLAPLRATDYDRYNVPLFTGRRWQYVNPLQDAQADALRLQMKQTSHQRLARDGGEDFTEIVQEIQDDDSLLKDAGLTAAPDAPLGAPVAGLSPKPPQDLEGDGSGA